MTNGTEKLKPCPFCGGKAVYSEFDYRGDRKCAIVCSNSECRCSAIHTFHIWENMPSATKAWNTRATHEEDI